MRRLLLGCTAATSLLVNVANAGGTVEPVMEPAVVEASTSSSSGGLIVPLLLLLIIAAAASGGGSDNVTPVSDRRVKTDIEWVGLSAESLPIYRYRYHGLSTRFEGVMAQDVLQRRPAAVTLGTNGIYAVDYSKLSVKMRVLH